ncbi:hypothetical protein JEQ12_009400 [Ovis aries]|uniref:Uncharacterized protein n=1 Tax=Ovis aries TaxID=9940 RepID=A0A836AJN0_SHEEP|nr:hypothetical protein JEQ12_009400 [Ovis aries]
MKQQMLVVVAASSKDSASCAKADCGFPESDLQTLAASPTVQHEGELVTQLLASHVCSFSYLLSSQAKSLLEVDTVVTPCVSPVQPHALALRSPLRLQGPISSLPFCTSPPTGAPGELLWLSRCCCPILQRLSFLMALSV